MEALVSPQVTAELTQILSNLVLGDNAIRSNAEQAVFERLSQTPEIYMLGLSQFAATADTDTMRSFSYVLMRRFLFRPLGNQTVPVYDQLSVQTLSIMERTLLHSLLHERVKDVRHKAADTISTLANYAMKRGRPWHALQQQAFTMAQSEDPIARENAFKVFAGSPNLIMDLQADSVVGVLQKGLQDPQSVEIQHIALQASVEYLQASDVAQQAQSLALLYPMLNTLPTLPHAHLPAFLRTLTPLASNNPALFDPHLPALLKFLPGLILPSVDSGPTPTVARPNPDGPAFTFPPPDAKGKGPASDSEDEETSEVRKAALEFMVSLTEARPNMVKRVDGWAAALVRGCLEGMGEIADEELEIWLESDPADDPTEETYPAQYEESIDRVAKALGGKSVLPPAFQYIPGMLVSHDWRLRHAGLMAISAIAEGTHRLMRREVGRIVELVVPAFKDPHPRVRYAACQCIGRLCTDLEDVVQNDFHQQVFNALIPLLEAPEPRVQAHAAAVLINFCEGAMHDILIPYLDPIVERLLKLLNPGTPGKTPKRYVQEQALTSLAMVADVSEATFVKHYHGIMPLLLNVLQNANTAEYSKLRLKAMECAGLIAVAVGREIFRPDASAFCEMLIRIQNTPIDDDVMLQSYTVRAWAKVCQALGPEFEPYLPAVMPPCLTMAANMPDMSVYKEDEEIVDREGWETVSVDGRVVGIKTSAIDEKIEAFETLVVYCSTLRAQFAPYLSQTLELTLPALVFYFHSSVREAAAMLLPELLSCGKDSGTLTPQMVSASFTQLVNCIGTERDTNYLWELYNAFKKCMDIVGGPSALPPGIIEGLVEGSKRHLQHFAERRQARARKSASQIEDERDEIAYGEQTEDFVLEHMERVLSALDPNHQLLVACGSVRDLGLHLVVSDEEDAAFGTAG